MTIGTYTVTITGRVRIYNARHASHATLHDEVRL
jgi:hypothetical protein